MLTEHRQRRCAIVLSQQNIQFSFRLIHRFPSRSSLLSFLTASFAESEADSSEAFANLKCANLSASFGARSIAGNDIGMGPGVLASGCSLVSKVVSGIAEAMASVCDGDSQKLRGSSCCVADLKREPQRVSAYHSQLDLGSDLQTSTDLVN